MMAKRKQLSPSQRLALINKFNRLYPVGSKVMWRSVNHDGVEYQEVTVQTPAYDSYGQPVCFFNERPAFCSIEPGFVDYPKGRPRAHGDR